MVKNKNIIGRELESKQIIQTYNSNKSELVSVYGRRRVGKTFLIKNMFEGDFDFYFSGLYETTKKQQLTLFKQALFEKDKKITTWFDAFELLKTYLLSLNKDKVVVFLDELPWMDTPKSNFIAAFSYFWNMWPSNKTLLKLYVCGSATTWMINKLIGDKGGLYGRVTCSIYLAPFTLGETELFLKEVKNIELSRYQILELYMILGGIPYYLDMLQRDLPLAKNIDNLFFKFNSPLKNEFDFLFRSLFKESKSYKKVIEILSKKKKGLTREEIINHTKITDGGTLSEILTNLCFCDFIREYSCIGKKQRESLFQLTDLFSLFYLEFVQKNNSQDENYWQNISNSGLKNAWCGYSFEQICFHHIKEIKYKLGILGVLCNTYSWNYKNTEDIGTQIDLLLDRKDDVINICEIKYANDEYEINNSYEEKLRHRASIFKTITKTKKAIVHTFITTYGIKNNKYSGIVQSQVTMDDLFTILK